MDLLEKRNKYVFFTKKIGKKPAYFFDKTILLIREENYSKIFECIEIHLLQNLKNLLERKQQN